VIVPRWPRFEHACTGEPRPIVSDNLWEEAWLHGEILGVLEVALADAYQAKTLRRGEIDPLSQCQCDIRQLLAR